MAEASPAGSIVTCVSVGAYEGGLSRGSGYTILGHDVVKRQVRVRGDGGRTRWFPIYCFDVIARALAHLESQGVLVACSRRCGKS
ncbi:hypothetical protein [Mycobacterium sp. C31M]